MTISPEELSKARIEALRIAKELATFKYLEFVTGIPSAYDRTAEQQKQADDFDAVMCSATKAWWDTAEAEKWRKREIGAAEAKAFMQTWGS